MDTANRMFRSSPRRTLALALALAIPVALGGCAVMPELGDGAVEEPPAAAPDSSTGTEEDGADDDDAPAGQAESCDWESPKLTTGVGTIPQNGEGELTSIIVGAWQHTHFDTGGGYEPTTFDHRYVFPTSERVLYCQHVPGTTDHAQIAVDFTWEDTRIALPNAPGYVVLSWDADTMVWLNPVDDSHYLLQRR